MLVNPSKRNREFCRLCFCGRLFFGSLSDDQAERKTTKIEQSQHGNETKFVNHERWFIDLSLFDSAYNHCKVVSRYPRLVDISTDHTTQTSDQIIWMYNKFTLLMIEFLFCFVVFLW